MAKTKKSKAEDQAADEFDLAMSTRLIGLILEDKKTRIHLEARMKSVPQKDDFAAVDMGACERNQSTPPS